MSDNSNRQYKQVARAQAQQRTREALLKAATDEFDEGRWANVSLEALSKRAGVTKQTLLRHFGSKDDLLLQALMRDASQLFDPRGSAPTEDIARTLNSLIDRYEQWGTRALRMGPWQGGSPLLNKVFQTARRAHYDWVEHAFAPWLKPPHGQDRGQDRARLHAALIALCDVHTWWLLSHELKLPRSEVHAILTDLVERLIALQPSDREEPQRA